MHPAPSVYPGAIRARRIVRGNGTAEGAPKAGAPGPSAS